ncbi:TetR/AcrR family transcriptional regulator [Parafrankia sp. FMc2]|uniref:TetR/AcrR family transcriptional regulator n=1 Tax=Parafrankia sp. FMc2 TaxID=3233196 RepID=UPI0034D4F1C1
MQSERSLVPGSLRIKIRYGQTGVVHIQPKVDVSHDDLQGDLRHALEEAALELVVTKGLGGFTMAETSRRADVSVAAPYKHYADRDALLAALVVRAYTDSASSTAPPWRKRPIRANNSRPSPRPTSSSPPTSRHCSD